MSESKKATAGSSLVDDPQTVKASSPANVSIASVASSVASNSSERQGSDRSEYAGSVATNLTTPELSDTETKSVVKPVKKKKIIIKTPASGLVQVIQATPTVEEATKTVLKKAASLPASSTQVSQSTSTVAKPTKEIDVEKSPSPPSSSAESSQSTSTAVKPPTKIVKIVLKNWPPSPPSSAEFSQFSQSTPAVATRPNKIVVKKSPTPPASSAHLPAVTPTPSKAITQTVPAADSESVSPSTKKRTIEEEPAFRKKQKTGEGIVSKKKEHTRKEDTTPKKKRAIEEEPSSKKRRASEDVITSSPSKKLKPNSPPTCLPATTKSPTLSKSSLAIKKTPRVSGSPPFGSSAIPKTEYFVTRVAEMNDDPLDFDDLVYDDPRPKKAVQTAKKFARFRKVQGAPIDTTMSGAIVPEEKTPKKSPKMGSPFHKTPVKGSPKRTVIGSLEDEEGGILVGAVPKGRKKYPSPGRSPKKGRNTRSRARW